MSEKVPDEVLIARSIEYSAANRELQFVEDFKATLVVCHRSSDLEIHTDQSVAVVHLMGGGALPYKVGSWVQSREVKGSMITLGVYKKHR